MEENDSKRAKSAKLGVEDLVDLNDFPSDLVKAILSHIKFPRILKMRLVCKVRATVSLVNV